MQAASAAAYALLIRVLGLVGARSRPRHSCSRCAASACTWTPRTTTRVPGTASPGPRQPERQHGLRGGARSSGGTAYLACGRGTEEQGASAERGWGRKKMMWGPQVRRGENKDRGSLDHTKIRRPVSGPKSIKYVENGTSQAKNEL